MSICDDLFELGMKRAKKTIWCFSDLQQSKYEHAERCLNICMEDHALIGEKCDAVFYLGDACQGNSSDVPKMVDMQVSAFDSLKIPLYYVCGNHDFDNMRLAKQNGTETFNNYFHDAVMNHEGWFTTIGCDKPYFSAELDDEWSLFFFSDHADPENRWLSTHNGNIWYGEDVYPYNNKEFFDSVRKEMNECKGKYLLTAGHCAFPGGARETDFMGNLQPLPTKLRLHLYGHAHIGEYRCPREKNFAQISWVDWQDIPQINVSSFEDYRGTYCRSVYLQIYENGETGVFFRNHNDHKFVSAFFPRSKSDEIEGEYYRQIDLIKNK